MRIPSWTWIVAAPLLLATPFACGNKNTANEPSGAGGSELPGGDDGEGGGANNKTDIYCTIAGAPCDEEDNRCCSNMVCRKRCCVDVGQACSSTKNDCCEGTKCAKKGLCKPIAVGSKDGGTCIEAFDPDRKCITARQCCKPLGSCLDGACCSQAGEGCETAEDCCSAGDCDPGTKTCVPKTGTDGAGGGTVTDGSGGGPSCAGLRQSCADVSCCDQRLRCDEGRSQCCIDLGDYYKMCSTAADCCGDSTQCNHNGLCCAPTGQNCAGPADCCNEADMCIDGKCGQCIADGEDCNENVPCCSGCNDFNTCGDPYG